MCLITKDNASLREQWRCRTNTFGCSLTSSEKPDGNICGAITESQNDRGWKGPLENT